MKKKIVGLNYENIINLYFTVLWKLNTKFIFGSPKHF